MTNSNSQLHMSLTAESQFNTEGENKEGEGKKTRALNSFVAFRSYYAPIFDGCEQATRSGQLSLIWSSEVNKAKWTVLAEVWTTITQLVGKKRAPLKKFLELTVSVIGVFTREEYLTRTGWTLSLVPSSGRLTVVRVFEPDFNSFPESIRSSDMSNEDLLQYCLDAGFYNTNKNLHKSQGLLTSHAKISKGKRASKKVSLLKNINKSNYIEAFQNDPMGMAAELLGIDPGHPFFEMATSPAAQGSQLSTGTTTSVAAINAIPAHGSTPHAVNNAAALFFPNVNFPLPITQVAMNPINPAPANGQVPQVWANNLNGFYDANEGYLQLQVFFLESTWTTFNYGTETTYDGMLCKQVPDVNAPNFDPINDFESGLI